MSTYPTPVPTPAADAVAPGISMEIYGMPMFTVFEATDIDATVAWYTQGLDFVVLFSAPGPDGRPMVVHLRRWHFQDILLRPAHGEASVAGTSATLNIAAVYGELDGLAERARAHGGGRVDGPDDTFWNTRDLLATDPDGNRVNFTAGRPPELIDQAFAQGIIDRFRAQQPAE